jgi:hypothetical protein
MLHHELSTEGQAFLFHPTILRIEFPVQEIPVPDIDGAESSMPELAPPEIGCAETFCG